MGQKIDFVRQDRLIVGLDHRTRLTMAISRRCIRDNGSGWKKGGKNDRTEDMEGTEDTEVTEVFQGSLYDGGHG
jgi:hypothetical protein